MKKVAILSILLVLSGCKSMSDAKPQPISYPDSLFTCPDKPNVNDVNTDNDLASFIAKQDAIITICKNKLKNVGELVRKNQPPKDQKE
jgi:hypothetical protein